MVSKDKDVDENVRISKIKCGENFIRQKERYVLENNFSFDYYFLIWLKQ